MRDELILTIKNLLLNWNPMFTMNSNGKENFDNLKKGLDRVRADLLYMIFPRKNNENVESYYNNIKENLGKFNSNFYTYSGDVALSKLLEQISNNLDLWRKEK